MIEEEKDLMIMRFLLNEFQEWLGISSLFYIETRKRRIEFLSVRE